MRSSLAIRLHYFTERGLEIRFHLLRGRGFSLKMNASSEARLYI